MPKDVESINLQNPELNSQISTNQPGDSENWSQVETDGITHDHKGLAVLRDWMREGFKRIDKGNLGEEYNSLNAVPMWDDMGNGAKMPRIWRISDYAPYGQIAFYVSSLPAEEHWLVYVDWSNENETNDNFTPKIHYCAINLVGNDKKFEDYYSISGQYVVSGITDTTKRPLFLEIAQTALSETQYRSLTLVENSRNDLANNETCFAKTSRRASDPTSGQGFTAATGFTLNYGNDGGVGLWRFRGVISSVAPDNYMSQRDYEDGTLWFVTEETEIPDLTPGNYWNCYIKENGLWSENANTAYGAVPPRSGGLTPPDIDEQMFDIWVNLNDITAGGAGKAYYRFDYRWNSLNGVAYSSEGTDNLNVSDGNGGWLDTFFSISDSRILNGYQGEIMLNRTISQQSGATARLIGGDLELSSSGPGGRMFSGFHSSGFYVNENNERVFNIQRETSEELTEYILAVWAREKMELSSDNGVQIRALSTETTTDPELPSTYPFRVLVTGETEMEVSGLEIKRLSAGIYLIQAPAVNPANYSAADDYTVLTKGIADRLYSGSGGGTGSGIVKTTQSIGHHDIPPQSTVTVSLTAPSGFSVSEMTVASVSFRGYSLYDNISVITSYSGGKMNLVVRNTGTVNTPFNPGTVTIAWF